MTHLDHARRATLVAAAAALAACTQGGRDDYAKDGDTGAAAPAAVLTPNHPTTADSTAGVSRRTGERGSAGDTTASGIDKGTIGTSDNPRAVPGAATGAPTKTP
jgi:hypothetical protein